MAKIMEHLQSNEVRKCLNVRHRVKQATRDYLVSQGFLEIDTPVLSPVIEEYTKQYFEVVPDGVTPQYSLPQSPQIYKQLLMLAGYKKYFQFAHCFRKDPEVNVSNHHAYEFMQIDVEMHIDSIDVLMKQVEDMILSICNRLEIECNYPFPVVSGLECKKLYGTDKPDLRKSENDFAFIWIKRLPLVENIGDFERIKVTSADINMDGKLFIPSHHIFAKPSQVVCGGSYEDLRETTTESFDLVLNGIEMCSGDLRITDRSIQEEMMDLFGVEKSRYEFYLSLLDKDVSNGGFAIGFDRITMLLSGFRNINLANAFSGMWWKD